MTEFAHNATSNVVYHGALSATEFILSTQLDSAQWMLNAITVVLLCVVLLELRHHCKALKFSPREKML